MKAENEKNAVSFMSRHFVALACEYESINADGSVYHRGTSVYSGFLMELHGRIFWVTAGHCLKDELDGYIDKGVLRITGGGFLDYFGHEATHRHIVPFTYEAHCAMYVEEPHEGIDFALLMLDDLQERAFAANKLIPITRENWIHQPLLSFDFYRMLGIPKDRVFPGKTMDDIQVQQAMVAVNQLSIEEVGDPPPDAAVPSNAWFIGRIDPGAELKDIRGMSGGPIYGFRLNSAGDLTYHVVALQSRWWDVSRTVFGCSVLHFAEAVYQQIDDFIQAYRGHAAMQAQTQRTHSVQFSIPDVQPFDVQETWFLSFVGSVILPITKSGLLKRYWFTCYGNVGQRKTALFRFESDEIETVMEQLNKLSTLYCVTASGPTEYDVAEDIGHGAKSRFLGTNSKHKDTARRGDIALTFLHASACLMLDCLVGPDENGYFALEAETESGFSKESPMEQFHHLFCNMTSCPTYLAIAKNPDTQETLPVTYEEYKFLSKQRGWDLGPVRKAQH